MKWGSKKPKRLLSKEEKIKIWTRINRNRAKNYWLNHGKDYIISKIQEFVIKNGRIPVKREMWGIYKPARKYFGTWNNVIIAAGFEPNPVLFAKRQLANDGHICDSIAEKMIDDYLYERKILHERTIAYPGGSYTADFKIGDKLIEYFGLVGEHKRYDELREIKQPELGVIVQENSELEKQIADTKSLNPEANFKPIEVMETRLTDWKIL